MIFDQPLPPTSATPYLWQVTIGDDWDFGYTYTNPDGSPVDVTGALPTAILFPGGATAVEMLDAASGVTIAGAKAGQVIFSVPRAVTGTLRPAYLEPDFMPTRIQVRLQDSLGKVRTYKIDPVQISDARTQPIGPLSFAPIVVIPAAAVKT